jgi:predicted AAA+ superfamily ATPase
VPTWSPSEGDYLQAITGLNPWHIQKKVPAELAKPYDRPLAQLLWQTVREPQMRRHQLILGPRRAGKTTVMYQTVRNLIKDGVNRKNIWWLRLDHPLLLDMSLGSLVQYIIALRKATADNPVYLFLDEITYSPKWALWSKSFHDEQWPVRIVGSSSATAAIKDVRMESGVGRWDEQHLSPCLFTEYLSLRRQGPTGVDAFDSLAETIEDAVRLLRHPADLESERKRYMLVGGFPELLVGEPDSNDLESDLFRSQRVLRSDAIERAVYKDIPQACAINDPVKLERLLYILAGQIGGVMSPNTIGQECALVKATIDAYVKYLEWAYLVFTLPNYAPSEEAVQRRGRKVYFVDGAVRNAALMRGLAPLHDPNEMGVLMENLVASHLNTLAQQAGIRLFHWRHKQFEVDLVFDHPERPLAFEVASSVDHSRHGLLALQERYPKFRGACYVICPNAVPRLPQEMSAGILPLDLFLLSVGSQTQHALEKRLGTSRRVVDGQPLLFRL